VYLGLRWEGIRTNSDNRGFKVRSTTSVWSPVLHGVWRIPGSEKDQVRASLTQSYRAPQLNDLIAAPSFSSVPDDPSNPDRSGNPDLKPELARGIDLAYEHYLGKSGILSASAFIRKIDDLMRRDLRQYRLGDEIRWISTPSNIGSADTRGIELEAKFQVAELFPDAPNVDVRVNYSRFWSTVDGIPGPDNRLDGQAEQTANIGVDYRFKGLPLTMGGNFNWTPETYVQVSNTERAFAGVKRQSDLYALWKFSANTQLRLSANNLAEDDYLGGRVVRIGGTQPRLATSTSNTRTFTTWGARLEMKL
jgi:iron complex outermembrane receptor protein